MKDRLDWDKYFLNVALQVAKRSTCPRLVVGTVVTKNNQIVGTGYNGAPSGLPHCTDVGCLIVNNRCVRVVHSEVNGVIQALSKGIGIDTLYCTHSPCLECAKIIINAQIKRVVYIKFYKSEEALDLLRLAKVSVEEMRP